MTIKGHVRRSFDSVSYLSPAINSRDMPFLRMRNGQTDGTTDRPTDGRRDGRKGRPSHRIARTHRKNRPKWKQFHFVWQRVITWLNENCRNWNLERRIKQLWISTWDLKIKIEMNNIVFRSGDQTTILNLLQVFQTKFRFITYHDMSSFYFYI